MNLSQEEQESWDGSAKLGGFRSFASDSEPDVLAYAGQ
jgi:hypothetical protein